MLFTTVDVRSNVCSGSALDRRGLPNNPFTVDSNRLSDGISSVSPLSTTGPSFSVGRNETDGTGNAA